MLFNDRKTELLVLGTRQQLSKTNMSHLRVGDVTVAASTSVTKLGSYFDTNFTMAMHVTKICSAAFFHIHNIRQIGKFLSHEATHLFTRLLRVKLTIVITFCTVFPHIISPSFKGYRMQQRA